MYLGELLISREGKNLIICAPHQSYTSKAKELIALLKEFQKDK